MKVVFHADDFGLTRSMNAGIVEATSAAFAQHLPHGDGAGREDAVGGRWRRPVSTSGTPDAGRGAAGPAARRIPSLVHDGRFWPRTARSACAGSRAGGVPPRRPRSWARSWTGSQRPACRRRISTAISTCICCRASFAWVVAQAHASGSDSCARASPSRGDATAASAARRRWRSAPSDGWARAAPTPRIACPRAISHRRLPGRRRNAHDRAAARDPRPPAASPAGRHRRGHAASRGAPTTRRAVATVAGDTPGSTTWRSCWIRRCPASCAPGIEVTSFRELAARADHGRTPWTSRAGGAADMDGILGLRHAASATSTRERLRPDPGAGSSSTTPRGRDTSARRHDGPSSASMPPSRRASW